jgi:hypothetical protein
MDNNIVNDITDLYFNQVIGQQLDEAKKPKVKRWWDNDDDGIGYEPGEVSGKFKRKKVKEAKEIKKWFDDDDDGIGYEPGEVSGKFKKKKKIKEGFSNWRNDLYEVIDKIEKSEKVVEKKVENKITINPSIDLGDGMRESIENLGGTLLEFSEIEDFEGVLDHLSESEIFFLSDNLIEQVVEEVFLECLEEGYDVLEIQDILLESLEVSSQIISESVDTDTTIKEDRLKKVKSAIKKVGKALAKSAGYAAGVAVRGAKALRREVSSGYQRGRHGKSEKSQSQVSDSSSTSVSKPGLLSRIASKLKRGLQKVLGKKTKVEKPENPEKPSEVHSKTGTRAPSLRRGIGAGKKIEVAGSPKPSKSEVKKVSVKDVTPKKPKSSEGTSENPRVGKSAPEKPKPKPKANPKVKTTTIKTDGPKNPRRARRRKGGPSVEDVKAQIDAKEKAKKERAEKRKKANELLKSLTKEELQLSEKSESKQQQRIFGLALSVKRGETPRSEVSAEVLNIVDSMSEKKIRDFAKTSHEGLPKKVQTKEEAIRESLLSKMIEKIEEQSVAAQLIQPKTQEPKSSQQKNTSQISQVLTARKNVDTAQQKLSQAQKIAAQRGVNLQSLSSSYELNGELVDEEVSTRHLLVKEI